MVLPPPAAHDESGARDADWIHQIKLALRLNRAGILIHVDQGRPEHLGKLVRALLPEHPNLDVFTDVRAVLQAEPGSVLVLVPKPEDADWLNLNRPIFAQRKLAVVLYCDRQTTLALADRAVDFFDWVSQHHTCPDGPPAFAVEGFRRAVANQAPGIVWTGDVEGLVRVLAAAFPGETLRWVVPMQNLEKTADTIRASGDAWVACRIGTKEYIHHFRLALAKVGKRTRAIAFMAKPECPGWWLVNDACLTLEDAQSIFIHAGMARPGRLAALTGVEKGTVELTGKLLHRGLEEGDLRTTLASDADPGVALAKKAHTMGLVDGPAVALRDASAPLLRALDDAPDVHAWRKARIEEVKGALMQGKYVSAAELGFWVAVAGLALPYDTHWRTRNAASTLFLLEGEYAKNRLDETDSRQLSSAEAFQEKMLASAPELSAVTITRLRKGKYVQALKSLATQRKRKPREFRRLISQIRARIWLDVNDVTAANVLHSAIEREGLLEGPSTPLFAELMVDLALLLHREGDAQTAFALLRKLLAAEWSSLHVDTTEAREATAKPTNSASVNDFVHLFLAQSNTSPPLPPESRARALRILAEVLLTQGRYEEAEDVAQRAHETALHAPEIARPETWRALALLGRARALQGRHADGKQDLQTAIELATHDFGKTHAEVARLWLDLARIQARQQDPETIRKTIDVWQHAQNDAKERDDALEELRRMIP